jgi:hypothetical protein
MLRQHSWQNAAAVARFALLHVAALADADGTAPNRRGVGA